MPGLIRGVARTAAIAGTATAVSNRVSRRQAGRWAEQEQAQAYQQEPAQPAYQAPPPAAAPDAGDDMFAQLEKLGQLRDKGILTDEEFAAQKAKLLAG
jgi:putative oligomerization/nucleic acid binding protein